MASIIDVRARLWNATFVEVSIFFSISLIIYQDYRDVEYVSLKSSARLVLDPNQGIEEDPRNNAATVSTHAYPDLPSIGETAPIPWWLIPAAVLAGFLILLLIIAVCCKLGFFKRKRPEPPALHKAQLHHEQEQWSS